MRRTRRKPCTPAQRQRAVKAVLERINPEKEPQLHAALFDVYLDELKEAMGLSIVTRIDVPQEERSA